MFRNSYIQIKLTDGGGYDDNNNPVEVVHLGWSDPIPAHINTLSYHNIERYSVGTFPKGKYVIFIEIQPFEAQKIRINYNGKDLDEEFDIQEIQVIERFGRLQITV